MGRGRCKNPMLSRQKCAKPSTEQERMNECERANERAGQYPATQASSCAPTHRSVLIPIGFASVSAAFDRQRVGWDGNRTLTQGTQNSGLLPVPALTAVISSSGGGRQKGGLVFAPAPRSCNADRAGSSACLPLRLKEWCAWEVGQLTD